MRKCILFICGFLLTSATLLAQNYTTLQGRVTDRKTKQGVPYTAVSLQGTCVGVQSNDMGIYKLKLENGKTRNGDSIIFSAIGYKKKTVSVAQLKVNGNISLEPHTILLQEVQVTGYSTPQAILDEAVRRIPENYHIDTTVGTWFRRDWRMLDGELYLFDESVVDMLRYGYTHNDDKTYYTFSDYRREMDDNYKAVRKHRLLILDSLAVRIASGDNKKAMADLNYSDNQAFSDPVATPRACFDIDADHSTKRTFDPIQEYTDADGTDYWILSHYSETSDQHFKAHYTLRIRQDNLAIVDITCVYDTGRYDYRPGLWSLQPWSSYTVHYNRQSEHYELRNGRYYLTHIVHQRDYTYRSHCNYGYELTAPEQRWTKCTEWLLTDLQPADTSFLSHNDVQSHKSRNIAQAFGQSSYDENFWEQYNTLPLDGNVQEALEHFFASSSKDSNDSTKILIADASSKRDRLDSLRSEKDTTALTLPTIPRWTFYRYGGIGGNRLVGTDTATHRGFSQQLGLGTHFHIGGRFSLAADLQYAWMTSRTGNQGRISTHNLTVPLNLHFDIVKPAPPVDLHIYLSAGGWGRFAFAGRLGDNWHVLGNSIDRWDYGYCVGIGIEFSRLFFIEWNSCFSLHNSILTPGQPEMYRHNGAFTLGIFF